MSPPASKEPKLRIAARRMNRSNSLASDDNPERPARRVTRSNSTSIAQGSGLIDLTTKEFHNDKTSSNIFTYWNDPNELVSRLQLLVSSASAGHTSHNNEIISIIEELREANIIE